MRIVNREPERKLVATVSIAAGAHSAFGSATSSPRTRSQKTAAFPAPVREAIFSGKALPGMHEQVLMAIAYPVVSENPSLDASVWRYWRDSWPEFQVQFDEKRLVKTVVGDAISLSRVFVATTPAAAAAQP